MPRGWKAPGLSGCALALAVWGLTACEPGRGPLVLPPLEYSTEHPWADRREPPPAGRGLILVVNGLEDTLSLLPLEGLGQPGWGELARVPVGLNPVEQEVPSHVVLPPTGGYSYVSLSLASPERGSGPHAVHGVASVDGYCLKLDTRTHLRAGAVRVDRNPTELVATADGRTLLLTHFDVLKIDEVARRRGPEREMDARLALIDTQGMARKAMVPVCPAPHAVRLSPDERRAYLACWSDEVAVVQLDALAAPVRRIKVAADAGPAVAPQHLPHALAVSPTTGAVWVSTLFSRSLLYLDPHTLEFDPRRTLRLYEGRQRGPPMLGAFAADGRMLYLPYQEQEGLAAIDTLAGQVVWDVELAPHGCLNARQALLTPDQRHALVVCEGDRRNPGTLHAVDLSSAQVTGTARVGLAATAVTLLLPAP
jgi:hypothetical protein